MTALAPILPLLGPPPLAKGEGETIATIIFWIVILAAGAAWNWLKTRPAQAGPGRPARPVAEPGPSEEDEEEEEELEDEAPWARPRPAPPAPPAPAGIDPFEAFRARRAAELERKRRAAAAAAAVAAAARARAAAAARAAEELDTDTMEPHTDERMCASLSAGASDFAAPPRDAAAVEADLHPTARRTALLPPEVAGRLTDAQRLFVGSVIFAPPLSARRRGAGGRRVSRGGASPRRT